MVKNLTIDFKQYNITLRFINKNFPVIFLTIITIMPIFTEN